MTRPTPARFPGWPIPAGSTPFLSGDTSPAPAGVNGVDLPEGDLLPAHPAPVARGGDAPRSAVGALASTGDRAEPLAATPLRGSGGVVAGAAMPAELEELLHDVRQAWGADVEVDDDLLAQLFVPKAGVWAGVPTVDHYRHLRVGDEP